MAFKLPNSSIKTAISATGYKSDSPDVDNDVNIIPSSKITMEGVDFPVKGVGSNGVTKNMKPGEDYDFGDADYVVETPIKQTNKRSPHQQVQQMLTVVYLFLYSLAFSGESTSPFPKIGILILGLFLTFAI